MNRLIASQIARTPSIHRNRASLISRPLIAFLLIASFGILFAGCTSQIPVNNEGGEFTFTADDLARFRELARDAQDEVEQQTGTGRFLPRLNGGSGSQQLSIGEVPVLDLANVQVFNALREGPGATGENLYRVTNAFLNVRSAPSVTASTTSRLVKGDTVQLLEFVDAAWAKVLLPNGTEGHVSTRYIAKLISEDQLAAEKAAFGGQYFVDFGFLNVRKAPDAQSEQLGELPGQTILRPVSMDDVWARIHFEGQEGYVAREYLTPFLPNFLVRQERYVLPVLHYRLDQPGAVSALPQHIERLRNAGYTFITLRDFYDLVLAQEDRDVRLNPKSVVLAFSGLTPGNIDEISDVLVASNVRATLFIMSTHLGLNGITEKQVLTLLANGFDLQSGAHSGDDLRSMTNAQVELELQQSRKILEDLTKREVLAIAYPWGGVNERVMQKAAEAGYLFGLGVAPKTEFTRGEFLQLPSLLVGSGMGGEDVLLLVQGAEK